MKKGVLILFVLLLLLPVVYAVPANPLPYPCEEGEPELCITIGDHWYSEDFTQNPETGEFDCPVIFDYEGGRKAFYAIISQSGRFEKPSDPKRLKDLSKERAIELLSLACGDEVRQVRPQRPSPLHVELEDQQPLERILPNLELGIGITIDPETGEFEGLSTTYEETLQESPPPNLADPKPVIVTGAVTYVPDFEPQEINVLVLLVQFPDQQAKVSVQEIEDKFFGRGGLAEYYERQSYGSFTLKGTVHPVWIDMPQNMGFYGGNYEARIQQMITESITLADPGVDFSRFDTDGDGVVDGFFVVHAGEPDENGGGNGPEIWSHYFSIPPITVDGVQVIDYETVSEESPIGIIAHEFGHYLGLPDLYDTVFDDGNSKGTGEWSIMGYGGYLDTPGSFDPWSKSFLGWLNEDNFMELTEAGNFDLVQDDATFGIRYYLMGLSPDEYFMAENRHSHKLIEGGQAGGVLIWHIDESVMTERGTFNGCVGDRSTCNAVNGNADHKFIDVEEADGRNDLDNDKLADKKDTWFESCTALGGCQANIFSLASNPSSLAYTTSENDVVVAVYSDIESTMQMAGSLTGEVLPPEGGIVEELPVVVEEPAEIVPEVQDGIAAPEAEADEQQASELVTGGISIWIFLVIGSIVLIVIIILIIIATSVRSKGGAIGPHDFKPFSRRDN